METSYAESLFAEEQIEAEIAGLADYEVFSDVASLNLDGGEMPPEVIIAFANLAKALKLSVGSKYSGTLFIRRRKPASELRGLAVERLQRQCEAGEIEAKAA